MEKTGDSASDSVMSNTISPSNCMQSSIRASLLRTTSLALGSTIKSDKSCYVRSAASVDETYCEKLLHYEGLIVMTSLLSARKVLIWQDSKLFQRLLPNIVNSCVLIAYRHNN